MIEADKILIEKYSYSLPVGRIALHPLSERDSSRLLVYKSGRISNERFYNLPQHFQQGDLLILNDTRVIEARILFQKKSGGLVEIFCLEPHQQSMETALQQIRSSKWKCLIGGASKWKSGQVLTKELEINGSSARLNASYVGKVDDGFIIQFDWQPEHLHFIELIHEAGAIPLPPYIKRDAEGIDSERYQTIFSRHEGSVAAPTAALHFTERIFSALEEKGISKGFITLNVGAGTFKPVKTASIAEHQMHAEDFTISKNTLEQILTAERVIAVGTTSLRTIESIHWLGVKLLNDALINEWTLGQWEAYQLDNSVGYKKSIGAIIEWMIKENLTELHCRTSLLIVPGYDFKIPAGLVTNFHQPQSTLLLLVAAFIGNDWKKVYQHAMENDYRFLSYGDSSLLWRN